MKQYDIAIIGAGVVGGMVARELTRLGQSVVLLERTNDVATGASRANSGIVHAGFDAKVGSLKAKLNVAGAEMMPSLCAEMGVPYSPCGSLVVGFGEEDDQAVQELYARGMENGVKGMEVLSGDDARKMEPNLTSEVTSALWAPSAGVVCPYELTIAAVGVAMQNGASLKVNFEVSSLSYEADGWHIFAGNEEVLAKIVINCAGAYSDKVAKMAGDDSFSITPRRGEYVLLDRECDGKVVGRTIFMAPGKMGKGVLVSPTAHGNVIIGPTAENIEDKDDVSTTAKGLATLRKLAGKSVDHIPYQKGITTFCGLRAVGNTGDFIINSPVPYFVNCAAIESPGLSASPALALYVAEMLEKMGVALAPKADFDPTYVPATRFHHLSIEEKNAIIAKDARYGRVICRCETVTEGEIVEAIHKMPPPHDLDGIKRRTRCGMGRCQGGFCTPYVTEIMAREFGVSELALSKSGGASPLLFEEIKTDDHKGGKAE